MKANWDRAISSVLLWEGGSAIRANEPGGAVNRGVSLHAFREEHPDASIQDLLNMSEAEAKRIYRKNYADKIGFDTLPTGLDVTALHGAVMLGVNGVRKMLDIAKDDYAYLIILMMKDKMHRDESAWRYMRGWSDRFVAIYALAKDIAGLRPS